MDIILIILMFILGLLFLITIHEFGHFIFAKLFGVYCFEFSIGFGKKLIRRKKKYSETYFCIGVVPLGGYVAMFGEDDDESEKRREKDKLDVEEKAKSLNNDAKAKKAKAKAAEYSEFTIIERKQYKLFKKQNKLIKLELEKLNKNNLKFKDSMGIELLTTVNGFTKEEAIQKVAERNVLKTLKLEKLIEEKDFYRVVDQKNLPVERDLEHVNRAKKLTIMSAGIAMNFIVGFILYLVSYLCFPNIAVSSILAASENMPANTTSPFVTQLNEFNAALAEDEKYVLEGSYVIFEKDLWEVKDVSNGFSLKYSVGTGILHDGENKVSVAAIPTNQFQFSDLSLDTQLYVTENKVNYYNFYEISASEYDGETTWEEYANSKAAEIAGNEAAQKFFDSLFQNNLSIKKEQLTLIKDARYQTSKDGAKIDSVDLNIPVVKGNLDDNLDAGFYIDEKDYDVKVLRGTLTMDAEKGLLSNTYLSFTSHERWLGAEAFQYAGEKWVDGTSLIFQTVGKLFIGQGWNSVGGPLAILTQSSTIFRNNPFSVYIRMWGLISVNLAVMNLLPIPGLDGWHIVVTLIESVIRRKLPAKFKKWASRIGLIFVFGLMIVILGLDVLRIFGVAI